MAIHGQRVGDNQGPLGGFVITHGVSIMAGGRPEFELTEEVLKEVEYMASKGGTMKQIAASLGIHQATLYKYKAKKDSELNEAIKRGKAKGVLKFAGHLYKQSKEGKTAATIFALINLDPKRWKQRPPEAAGGSDKPDPVEIKVSVVDGRIADTDTATSKVSRLTA